MSCGRKKTPPEKGGVVKSAIARDWLGLDDRSLIALRGHERRGGDVCGLLALTGKLRLLGEELDHVRDLRVATGFQRFFDAAENHAKLRGVFSVELLDFVALFRNDVIGALVLEIDLIKTRAVVEIAHTHKADYLEGGEATINRDEVARRVGQVSVNLFDAGRLSALDERFEDGHARLGDAQTRCF